MSLYKQPGSEVWHASLSRPGFPRIRRSTGETDRQAAQLQHDIFKVELWQAQPPVAGESWGDAVAAWCDAEQRSESELLSLAKLGRLYPDRPLIECTAKSFEEALAFCKTAGTYTRYRTMIMAIMVLAKAPLKLAVRKDKKKKTKRWLTRPQWTALHAALPEHLKAPAAFALETGLRQENVLGLVWARVDLERRLVWVEAEDMKGDEPISVPLNDRAMKILEAQRASVSVVGGKRQLLPTADVDTFVFTLRGKRIGEIKTAFMSACHRAGVGELVRWTDSDGKLHQRYSGFNWHGLRHTWATWHVQNQTPLDVLQKLGGWSDMRMVMTYAHHSPGHLAQFAGNSGAK